MLEMVLLSGWMINRLCAEHNINTINYVIYLLYFIYICHIKNAFMRKQKPGFCKLFLSIGTILFREFFHAYFVILIFVILLIKELINITSTGLQKS